MFNTKIILSTIMVMVGLNAFANSPAANQNKSSASASSAEKTIMFKSADGKTEFTAVGKPAMIKINGEGEGPEGTAKVSKDLVQLDVKVNLEKLSTKIDLRDEHMKNKYLETSKYPTANLVIKDLKLKESLDGLALDKDLEVPFNGDLTLHGKTQSVTGTAIIKKQGTQIIGSADFTIKIMEHLDTLPSWAGIKVADEVKVKVSFKGAM